MVTAPNPVDPATIAAAPSQLSEYANPFSRGLQLWHLLSLDAPSVAVLWTWFLARTNHVALPVPAILAMGIAVWMLYAADRLLDTRALQSDPLAPQGELEPRHFFHRRHRKVFQLALTCASLVLAVLLPSLAPQSIRLYLALGTLVFGYFILIHVSTTTAPSRTHRLPKEIAVGIFFSAAVFIPTIARNPTLRLVLLPGAILFAVLCCMNCLFIYAWEHPATSYSSQPEAHPATKLALRFLPSLAIAATVSSVLFTLFAPSLPWPIPTACGTASLLLTLLHKNHRRFSPTTLRAAADLCLLTPLLFLHY